MSRKTKGINRREFMSRSVLGLGSVGFFGVSKEKAPLTENRRFIQKTKGEIIHRNLGKTGIRIPIVNMGVMNTLDAALVKKSYEIGVRHFDTAAWYMRGGNEKMLGEAIKELGVRDKVIIGTKVYVPHQQRGMSPDKAKETYLRIAEESLKNLQTDCVDILYSHNVTTLEWLNNPGIIEALQQLKKQGKTRFIGFSVHTNIAECIGDAIRSGVFDVIETAYNYAMSDDQTLHDTFKKAVAKGIGLVAMKTQCTQYWYRENVPSDKQSFYEGKIMHTAVLKWALRNDFITTAIPGYTTFQQMEEDFSVARNLEFTEEEKKFLDDREIKLSLGYCRQCRKCQSTCPRGVDIPALMRIHMYAVCYNNFNQARDALDEICSGKGLKSCISCTTCSAMCANRIDIPRRMSELKAIYS